MAHPAPEHLAAAGGDDVAFSLVVDTRHNLEVVRLCSGVRGGRVVVADAAEEGGREARQQASPCRGGGGADRRFGAVHELLYLEPALQVRE